MAGPPGLHYLVAATVVVLRLVLPPYQSYAALPLVLVTLAAVVALGVVVRTVLLPCKHKKCSRHPRRDAQCPSQTRTKWRTADWQPVRRPRTISK